MKVGTTSDNPSLPLLCRADDINIFIAALSVD